jgi:molybdopterin adenylyltransferase
VRPHASHRAQAPAQLSFEVITVSSSRHEKASRGESYTDESGDIAVSEVLKKGHSVSRRGLVPDKGPMIDRAVRKFLSGKADVLLLAGGTGIARSDVTVETVRPFLEKELDGFGELIRRISYDEIGSAAILTRATAGVAGGKVIICLPGSPAAVRTAMRSVISEIPHMAYVARL